MASNIQSKTDRIFFKFEPVWAPKKIRFLSKPSKHPDLTRDGISQRVCETSHGARITSWVDKKDRASYGATWQRHCQKVCPSNILSIVSCVSALLCAYFCLDLSISTVCKRKKNNDEKKKNENTPTIIKNRSYLDIGLDTPSPVSSQFFSNSLFFSQNLPEKTVKLDYQKVHLVPASKPGGRSDTLPHAKTSGKWGTSVTPNPMPKYLVNEQPEWHPTPCRNIW